MISDSVDIPSLEDQDVGLYFLEERKDMLDEACYPRKDTMQRITLHVSPTDSVEQ
ncbi:MAG: hypothetical protein WCT49_04710 [Candidatus Paceibacterota bacterium]|jgi:hypothetical protein|nr:hypothetical protein [Candidatus Paceibacterota bacterium]